MDSVFVWLVNHFLEFVAEQDKSFLTVTRHGEMDFSLDVVPVKGDAAIFVSLLILFQPFGVRGGRRSGDRHALFQRT